jgi:hypothetical protein
MTDACTLPTADRPLRQAEFDALFARALRSVERASPTHARFVLDGPVDVIADLTERESQCCAFFTFTIESTSDGTVNLDVTVPPAYVAVLDGLVGRAPSYRLESEKAPFLTSGPA